MNQNVVVAQPGSHHLWRTAVALDRAHMLAAYVTGILYRPRRFPYTLLGGLPRFLRNRFHAELSKRGHPELETAPVVTVGLYEWLYLLVQRLVNSPRLSRWLIDRRNARLSACMGNIAIRRGAIVLWSGMDASRAAFEHVKPRGIICILDAFIGHPRVLNASLDEEARRWPQLMSRDRIPTVRLRNLEAEFTLADAIVTGSEFAKETFVEQGIDASRVYVIPYGVDTDRFTPPVGRRTNRFEILFVGNVSVRKGCHHLIEAMRSLPDLHLTLVGTLEDPLLIADAGANVTWHPPLPHDRMAEVFHAADAYAFPSLFEGSALSIYEALASGLPVVTTRESGSVIQDGVEGFIVPAQDPASLMERLTLLSDDTALRIGLGIRARECAERYTWDTYYQRVTDLVRSLTGN